MAYTHFKGVSATEDGFAVGKKGQEVVVIDGNGNFTVNVYDIVDAITMLDGSEIVFEDGASVEKAKLSYDSGTNVVTLESLDDADLSVESVDDLDITAAGMLTLSGDGTSALSSISDTMTINGETGAMLRCVGTGTADVVANDGNATVSATGGDAIIVSTDGAATLSGVAGVNVGSDTGEVDITAVADAVDINAVTGITIDCSAAGVSIQGVGAASDFSSEDGDLSLVTASSGDIILDSVDAVEIDAQQASFFNVTGNALVLSTTTSGDLAVTSAGELTLSGTAVGITGTVASQVSITGADLTIQTLTTGDLSINSVDDLELVSGGNAEINSDGTIDLIADNSINIGSDNAVDILGLANSSFVVSEADLVLRTQTSGDVSVLAADEINITASGGAVAIDASAGAVSIGSVGAHSDFTSDGGNLSLLAVNSGAVIIAGIDGVDIDSSDSTVTATGTSITLTASDGNMTLHGDGYVDAHANYVNISATDGWVKSVGGNFNHNYDVVEYLGEIALTDAAAETLFDLTALSTKSGFSGVIEYSIFAQDASDVHVESGSVHFAAASKGDSPYVWTTDITESGTKQAITNAGGGGTLSSTWAFSTALGVASLQVTADSNLTTTGMWLSYHAFIGYNTSLGSITFTQN